MNASNQKPTQSQTPFRSGFVALIGRPNVGKSTLLNALVGQTIAIATPKPQTTRHRIRGIVNRPNSQIILVDTPGMHVRDQAINRFMQEEAQAALSEVDVVVLLIEATGRGGHAELEEEDRQVLESVARAAHATLLVINKVDLLADKALLLPLMERYHQTRLFEEIFPLSATAQDGLDRLLQAIESRLPQGPAYYPEDVVTDQTVREIAAELVREQVIVHCSDEIPYCIAVEILSFVEAAHNDLVRIEANILVERDSQKGIIIGKGGQQIKRIGTAARRSIEDLLERRVHLQLLVKVSKRWSHTTAGLRKVGLKKT